MKAAALLAALAVAAAAQDEGLFKSLKGLKGAADKVKKTVESEDFKKAVKTVKAVRRGATDMTEEEEHFLGRAVAARVLSEYPPVADEALNRYVQTVLQAVAGFSDRPETFKGWHAQVVESDEPNALSAPGGFVIVTTGLLDALEDEEELAAVLAHEVAHVSERHGVKTIKAARLASAFELLGTEAAKRLSEKDLGKVADHFKGSVDDVVKALVKSGYSQDKEFDADRKGAEFTARAMYDPQALNRFIERTGKGKGGFLKTHPGAKKRLAALDEEPVGRPEGYAGAAARKKRFEKALAAR